DSLGRARDALLRSSVREEDFRGESTIGSSVNPMFEGYFCKTRKAEKDPKVRNVLKKMLIKIQKANSIKR
ncbi:MAG: hypothetical protein ACFFBD_27395, partial [Candidatus Hodarchaeota archaeon]